jgi:hypothetical protein
MEGNENWWQCNNNNNKRSINIFINTSLKNKYNLIIASESNSTCDNCK